jgi:7-keto-8-aminopelargonate synthetase-like enzyme
MEGWKEFLEERERLTLLRRLVPAETRRPGFVVRGGREYVDFSSNDYLGLSSHPPRRRRPSNGTARGPARPA